MSADAPFDGPLDDCPLAFVDLEMTGLDLAHDRIVEVCVLRVRGSVVEAEIETLVGPDPNDPDAAKWKESARPGMKVHGIDAAAIAAAAPFSTIADAIEHACEGAAIVAHGAEWDVKFLSAAFTRIGRKFTPPCVVDTLRMSRRAFALPSHSLQSLAKHWGVAHTAHRAHGDVLATRVVFERCVAELKPKSARDLADVRVGDRVAREDIVLACEEACQAGTDVRLVYRRSGAPRLELVFRVTAVDRSGIPPRVLGYEVASRARRDLRADRILSCEPALSPRA